ncbi:MAG: hypothetical protein ABUK01_01720 [Leptospirales bacterium]
MDSAILFPLILWLIFGFFILVRTPVNIYARIIVLVFLAWNVYFFIENPQLLLKPSELNWGGIFKQSVESALHGLIWVWPLTLIYSFYASSDRDVNINLTILSAFTAIVWVLYLIFI